jgi:hypothetical protein
MEKIIGDLGVLFAACLVILYLNWDHLFPE